ncbi:group III truncated hemoglobin [Lampropedia aestuarii]|uniref:group III truncated hemoglobin n=1 Tax=Lampropedia aestuarii TaxID=2562762 RepID=UPI00246834CC|nr:group III truncated hemoglobin [Lampropedia aestuarii]MDH5858267.1 group III truncated hemoglobin [Lampropedia aestuarii]
MGNSQTLCTEAEIETLVQQFYGRVRADATLGPIFNAKIDDWVAHERLLSQFWSSVLLRTGRFSGSPMRAHAQLQDLSPALFERWLAIFSQVCDQQPNQAMAAYAQSMAQRMAQSLWMGWQMQHSEDGKAVPSVLTRVPLGGV